MKSDEVNVSIDRVFTVRVGPGDPASVLGVAGRYLLKYPSVQVIEGNLGHNLEGQSIFTLTVRETLDGEN